MKFKVKNGRVKECLHKQIKGQWFYVTPKKGWLVAHSNEAGDVVKLANECEEYVDTVEDAVFTEVV